MQGRVVILGPGGSGKDFLKRKMQNKGYRTGIMHTTRPIRNNEKNGVDYHYVTREAFIDMIDKGEFVEYNEFNGWFYGTSKQSWNEANLFVMNPRAIKQINESIGFKDSFIIYINPSSDIIESRLKVRNDADSVERRMKSDADDFKDFKIYDIKITNPDF